jgi:elongator complex protein 5
MAPSILVQRRTHNLLLLQKLLNLRDGASPFTLLLDTLEQSAQPVLQEFMERAKVSGIDILCICFHHASTV